MTPGSVVLDKSRKYYLEKQHTMIQVKVAPANRAAGYLDDRITWINNSRHGHFH